MNPLLRDLYGHQAWADARLWRAIEAHPSAFADEALRERLHHVHQVQRLFLWIVRFEAEPLPPSRPEDFTAPADLKAYARAGHEEAAALLGGLDEVALARRVTIPFFRDPPLDIRVDEALAQAAMHSTHHRGQNAMRLRQLGGKPPVTDLILWYAKGRPAPAWS
jgi:uncharacterized damage-inducible protein DinB